MKKIQIHFTESDYNVYYDYCGKYYRIHDTVRKQSIHAFLDLFEKGILPVDKQDISDARQLLSRKGDELKKEHKSSGKKGDTAMLLQMRICADLLLFIEDLEKIHRLIKKQGIVADYVMMLGTFSRVIEENENAELPLKYELNGEVIDALARPLADSIRPRLGADKKWRPVLRELTVIAARFNKRSPEHEFDADILRLVAPAVVSHFDEDAETREILSLVPSYFEDRELEEFETFLNRTPEGSKPDTGIDWDAIDGPLKVVAEAVAVQRERWFQDHAKTVDPLSPALPSGILTSKPGQYPLGAMSLLFPALLQVSGNQKFDIVVGDEVITPEESPLTGNQKSEAAPGKPGIQSYYPVIIGIAAILLIIFGTMIISGDWNLTGAGNTTNSTSGSLKNITPVKTTAVAGQNATSVKTTPIPGQIATTSKPTAAPTAKVGNTTASPTAAPTTAKPATTPTPVSYSSVEVGNHLIEIAFGPDNNVIQKPTKDLIAIAYSDKYDDSDMAQLNAFINQFNGYSTTTKISTNVNMNSQGDVWLNFLPGTTLSQIAVDPKTVVYKDLQTGTFYFIRTSEKTYVNSDLKGDERKRWALRALLNNLGFYGDTAKYPDSLFYSGTTNATQMRTIDLKVLQLLYGKKIINGMTKNTVKTLF